MNASPIDRTNKQTNVCMKIENTGVGPLGSGKNMAKLKLLSVFERPIEQFDNVMR